MEKYTANCERKYARLSFEDRKHIERWFREGLSIRKIAKMLGRSPNTVSREIHLHKTKYCPRCGKWIRAESPRLIDGWFVYGAEKAQETVERKKKKSKKPKKLDSNDRLLSFVEEKLREGLKPDVISGRMRVLFPKDESMRVCAETIYSFVYSNLDTGLFEYLEKPRKKRRKRTKRSSKKRIRERVSIAHRGKKAKNRKEIGHFEADSVIGKTGGSGKVLQTVVDRKSRMIFAGIAKDKTAEKTLNNLLSAFSRIPKGVPKTVTFDNGSEFSLHFILAKKIGARTYFADPYSSWQRGTNERHNRMLRKFFPKGTDFSKVTEEELSDAVNHFNNMPRKILGYLTPIEVWERELSKTPRLAV